MWNDIQINIFLLSLSEHENNKKSKNTETHNTQWIDSREQNHKVRKRGGEVHPDRQK